MYKALIDRDSLIDAKVLDNYEVKETYEEKWEGENPELLTISKLKVNENEVDNLVKNLSSVWLQEEWFAVIWNEEKVSVVFKGKVLTLQNSDPWSQGDFAALVQYGEVNNIDRKYFLNMRKVMAAW
jgi:hypothetical protein